MNYVYSITLILVVSILRCTQAWTLDSSCRSDRNTTNYQATIENGMRQAFTYNEAALDALQAIASQNNVNEPAHVAQRDLFQYLFRVSMKNGKIDPSYSKFKEVKSAFQAVKRFDKTGDGLSSPLAEDVPQTDGLIIYCDWARFDEGKSCSGKKDAKVACDRDLQQDVAMGPLYSSCKKRGEQSPITFTHHEGKKKYAQIQMCSEYLEKTHKHPLKFWKDISLQALLAKPKAVMSSIVKGADPIDIAAAGIGHTLFHDMIHAIGQGEIVDTHVQETGIDGVDEDNPERASSYGWANCLRFSPYGPNREKMDKAHALKNADNYAYFGLGASLISPVGSGKPQRVNPDGSLQVIPTSKQRRENVHRRALAMPAVPRDEGGATSNGTGPLPPAAPSTKPATTGLDTTKPASTQLTNTEPGTAIPGSTNPGRTKPVGPGTSKPASTQLTNTEPDTTKPGTTKTETTGPENTKPTSAKPTSAKPPSAKPPSAKPGTTEPANTVPASTKHTDSPPPASPISEGATTKPANTKHTDSPPPARPTSQGVTTQPANTEPTSTGPANTNHATAKPSSTNTINTEPGTTETVTRLPSNTEPISTKPTDLPPPASPSTKHTHIPPAGPSSKHTNPPPPASPSANPPPANPSSKPTNTGPTSIKPTDIPSAGPSSKHTNPPPPASLTTKHITTKPVITKPTSKNPTNLPPSGPSSKHTNPPPANPSSKPANTKPTSKKPTAIPPAGPSSKHTNPPPPASPSTKPATTKPNNTERTNTKPTDSPHTSLISKPVTTNIPSTKTTDLPPAGPSSKHTNPPPPASPSTKLITTKPINTEPTSTDPTGSPPASPSSIPGSTKPSIIKHTNSPPAKPSSRPPSFHNSSVVSTTPRTSVSPAEPVITPRYDFQDLYGNYDFFDSAQSVLSVLEANTVLPVTGITPTPSATFTTPGLSTTPHKNLTSTGHPASTHKSPTSTGHPISTHKNSTHTGHPTSTLKTSTASHPTTPASGLWCAPTGGASVGVPVEYAQSNVTDFCKLNSDSMFGPERYDLPVPDSSLRSYDKEYQLPGVTLTVNITLVTGEFNITKDACNNKMQEILNDCAPYKKQGKAPHLLKFGGGIPVQGPKGTASFNISLATH